MTGGVSSLCCESLLCSLQSSALRGETLHSRDDPMGIIPLIRFMFFRKYMTHNPEILHILTARCARNISTSRKQMPLPFCCLISLLYSKIESTKPQPLTQNLNLGQSINFQVQKMTVPFFNKNGSSIFQQK